MNPKFSLQILSTAALILASSPFTQAANILTTNTVGTINGNGKTITEATGNSFTATTFASNLATAFSNNTGGVWNFETAFNGNVGDTVTLNYGTAQTNSLVLTLTAGNNINQATGTVSPEMTSGVSGLGFGNDATTRTFTLSTPLLSIGIFNTNRSASDRTSSISVTYFNGGTASTSGANGGATFFQGLSGTLANPIVSFSISQSNFVRYDDLGFITASAVPEPASAATLVGLAAVGFVALRRRRSQA